METKDIQYKAKFEAKYIINFDLNCLTGLHIGGGDTAGRIGELDNPVLKDALTGLPYIAGSSLKGRIRERLEWTHIDKAHQKTAVERQLKDEKGNLRLNVSQCNCGNCDICHYFGHSNQNNTDAQFYGPTRILVRDAFPAENQKQQWEKKLGKNNYTEVKYENTISRLTAIANPRQMERVPAGSLFKGEIVIDIYDLPGREADNIQMALTLLFKGMMLIENSFLGGGGSRGSGVVKFNAFGIKKLPASYYEKPEEKPKDFPIDKELSASDIFKSKAYENVN